jgi:hypothetical protein
MYYDVICELTKSSYVFTAIYDLLQKIHVRRGEGRQVRLAVLQKEVIELLLRLHLGAELVDAHLLVGHDY